MLPSAKNFDISLSDRFWANVKRGDNKECWPWKGKENDHQYSYIWNPLAKERIGAHRLAYKLEKGELPEGYEVDHTCFNTRCCNPSHLEAVTHRENCFRSKTRRDIDGNLKLIIRKRAEVRKRTFNICLSDLERRLLSRMAEVKGLSCSSFLGQLIRELAVRTKGGSDARIPRTIPD